MFANTASRFAFVEYESRRDADDAYHEMHNKRLGRDDVLKIEVRSPFRRNIPEALNHGRLTLQPVGSYSSFSVLAI